MQIDCNPNCSGKKVEIVSQLVTDQRQKLHLVELHFPIEVEVALKSCPLILHHHDAGDVFRIVEKHLLSSLDQGWRGVRPSPLY